KSSDWGDGAKSRSDRAATRPIQRGPLSGLPFYLRPQHYPCWATVADRESAPHSFAPDIQAASTAERQITRPASHEGESESHDASDRAFVDKIVSSITRLMSVTSSGSVSVGSPILPHWRR